MAAAPTRPIHHDLKAAPWLAAPSLARVFAALDGGGETRIIGGAVRNALLGQPVADIDLATILTPAAVIERATHAGLAVYPTGIDHGTVTVVADGHPYEVTTLRRDVETDGRRAVVAFTADWHEDALRRDFTINALSADASGNVFDTVGGLDDLENRRVRFIGSPQDRIREDYLRILRFFRFTSAYASGPPDPAGLSASASLKDGLQRLSAERIGAEMMNFIVTPRAGEIAAIMQNVSVLRSLVPFDAVPERLARMQAIEAALGMPPDAIARMAALLLNTREDAPCLAKHFRLSSAEISALAAAADVNPDYQADASEHAARAQIYRVGSLAFRRALRGAWARSGAAATDRAWTQRDRLAASWTPPVLPVSGTDVLALGIPAGPRVGRTLKAFEAWWIDAGFPDDHAVQNSRLAALAEQS
jgi:poly(A) polymerase